MIKSELKGKLVAVLVIALIVTSVFSGAVSAGDSVASSNHNSDNPVIPEENSCNESTTKNAVTANLNLSERIDEILADGKLPFLFFYAGWCGFCEKQKPIIEELEKEYADSVEFIWLNAEKYREEAQEFGVRGYPTMFLVVGKERDGYRYKRFGGYTERDELVEKFEKIIETGTADNVRVLSFDEGERNDFGCSSCGNLSDFNFSITQENITSDEFFKKISNDSESVSLYTHARKMGYEKTNRSIELDVNNKSVLIMMTLISKDGDEIYLVKFLEFKKSYLMGLKNTTLTLISLEDTPPNSLGSEAKEASVEDAFINSVEIDLDDLGRRVTCLSFCMDPDLIDSPIEAALKNFVETGLVALACGGSCASCIDVPNPFTCVLCLVCLGFTDFQIAQTLHCVSRCESQCGFGLSISPEDDARICNILYPDRYGGLAYYVMSDYCYYRPIIIPQRDDILNCCDYFEKESMTDYCEAPSACQGDNYWLPIPECTSSGIKCNSPDPTPTSVIEYCSMRNFETGQCGFPTNTNNRCSNGEGPIEDEMKRFPAGVYCYNCAGLEGAPCQSPSDCISKNCGSCTGEYQHCCPKGLYWDGSSCVEKCLCEPGCPPCTTCGAISSRNPETSVTQGPFCEPDDSNPNDECSGNCCGGFCYTTEGICCNAQYYQGSNACCDGTNCGPNEECIYHTCLKLDNVPCSSNSECKSGNCAGCLAEKRCCPEGMKWDGSRCVYGCDAPVSCQNTCNPGNRQLRWYDAQPYAPNGYDNDGDGFKEAACPLNHNKVLDVNGDGEYDCCYLQEECPEGTLCSAGICTIEPIETCSQAGYQCCDACVAGTEHPEYTGCYPKVCCEECQFSGCNPYCPDPTGCDIIKSMIYSNCCNPNDPNCENVVKQYTSAGWQMCGYHNFESCCAGWKEDKYCSGWQDDGCGGGNCPLGLMHQTRDCWGPAEGDCPESRCAERKQCEELVIGVSYARLDESTIALCTDEGTVNGSCSYSNTFYLESNGEIYNHVAEGDMVFGFDDPIFYCEGNDNTCFQYWEPLSSGSVTNFIEMKHQESYPAGCYAGYIYYGGCCYRYRCNPDNTDCEVTIKCPMVEMNKPALKAPLSREQYYDFDVYPHIVWFAASAGQDSLSCNQMRNEVNNYLLDPCEVTIDGETYYSDTCLNSKCTYGLCLDEKHAGFSIHYRPFFFAEEIKEITKPDLVPHSVNTNGPLIETQDAFIEVVIKNKLDIFGSGVDTDAGFYVDVYVNDTFVGRKAQYGLQNGSSVKLYYIWENATVGLHELKAHVDSTNSIDEREEGNNWITKIVEVQPKTDIAANNLNIDASTAKSGDTVPLTVTLHNHGTSDTNEFVTTLSVDTDFQAYNITSLTAGESQQISFNWTAILGEHNLTITADSLPEPDGLIPETNELNNSASQAVNILIKGNTTPILSYTFESGYFFDGVEPDTGNESTIFDYYVKYTDYDDDSPASGHPTLWIDINGDGDYNDVIGGFAEGNFTMTEVDPSDGTYTDGKIYSYNTTLPAGENITYKFEAFDETGRNATGDTGVISGPYVYAEAENQPPIANFTYLPKNPVVNDTITFNASNSTDPDGFITNYNWSFGDGTNGTGEVVGHSYSSAGTYNVTLMVTDDDGATNSTSKIVSVNPAISIWDCQELNQTGATYYLTADIINSFKSKCIKITAENVTLDCQGHNIDGDDSAQIGIFASPGTNITIKDCIVTDWAEAGIWLSNTIESTIQGVSANSNHNGIVLEGSSYNTLSDIIANSNTLPHGHGIGLYDSDYNILSNITTNSNEQSGVLIDASSHNTLRDVTAMLNKKVGIIVDCAAANNTIIGAKASFNCKQGICLMGGTEYTTIRDSKIENNGPSPIPAGILLCDHSNNNIIYNNLFNNEVNVYFVTSDPNTWNTSKQLGTRIHSAGNYIGGNYWTNPSGTGYSDTCLDSDGDGFCDNSLTLATDNIDYLPLSDEYQPSNLTIFDTGAGTYPSIMGIHNGTIKPNQTIVVSKLYTYPCAGTGGHTEHVRIWNDTWVGKEAYWKGYQGDWHNITFDEPFTLFAEKTYNYEIRTGSYPQIIHKPEHTTLDDSFINCTSFVDANGKEHIGWIPAIRLWS